jgi:hypothetical protein
MMTSIGSKKSIAAAVALTATFSFGMAEYSWSATPQVRGQWAGLMARITSQQLPWLPEGSALRWSNGLQVIQNHYKPGIKSRGQATTEPFWQD